MGISQLISNPQQFLLQALYSLPAILIALSFHEWAHAYAAYKRGDPTARNLGRMTINPLKHIDPVGFITLLLFRFGWAKPVPINSRNFKNYRVDDIIVSLAGVACNFLLGIVGMVAIYVFAALRAENMIVANMLYYFVYINFALMIFNLVPIPPLDGSHVLESLLIRKVGPKPFLFLQRYGYMILLALLVTGVISSLLGSVVSWIMGGLEGLLNALFDFQGLTYLMYIMLGIPLS